MRPRTGASTGVHERGWLRTSVCIQTQMRPATQKGDESGSVRRKRRGVISTFFRTPAERFISIQQSSLRCAPSLGPRARLWCHTRRGGRHRCCRCCYCSIAIRFSSPFTPIGPADDGPARRLSARKNTNSYPLQLNKQQFRPVGAPVRLPCPCFS